MFPIEINLFSLKDNWDCNRSVLCKSRSFIKSNSFGSADFLSSPLKRAYTKRTLKCVLRAFVPKIFIPYQREYSQEFRMSNSPQSQQKQSPCISEKKSSKKHFCGFSVFRGKKRDFLSVVYSDHPALRPKTRTKTKN